MTVDELREELAKMYGSARVQMDITVFDETEDGRRYGYHVVSDIVNVRGGRFVLLEGRE